MNKTQGALLIAIVIIIIGVVYLITDKVDICEQAKNDSYNAGFNLGNEEGFNQGYFNGSIDYLIEINQKNVFPCLNFKTGEFSTRNIGGLCQNG